MNDLLDSQIAGVVVGFLLGTLGTYGLERIRERRHGKSVHRLLHHEFELNLHGLQSHWEGTKEPYQPRDNALTSRESRFVRGIFPPWSRAVWNSQTQHLGFALDEEETAAALQLQGKYDILTMLRERIKPSLESDKEIRRINAQLWAEIENLVTTILDEGNPIKTRD